MNKVDGGYYDNKHTKISKKELFQVLIFNCC